MDRNKRVNRKKVRYFFKDNLTVRLYCYLKLHVCRGMYIHGASACHQDQGAETVSLGPKGSPLEAKANAIPV